MRLGLDEHAMHPLPHVIGCVAILILAVNCDIVISGCQKQR
jgi:hypothetical protein